MPAPRAPEALKQVAGDIHAHQLEVTDYGAVKALAAKLKGEAIDVLICNAGVAGREAGDLGRIVPRFGATRSRLMRWRR